MRGLESAETGGAFVSLDAVGQGFETGDAIHPETQNGGIHPVEDERVVEGAPDMVRQLSVVSSDVHETGLKRQSTLLTAGANANRRAKELDRLLAPTNAKKSLAELATVIEPATPSESSAATASSQARAPSAAGSTRQIASPVVLEQAKSSSKARVELDLHLGSALVVEGGKLNGRVEIRVSRPKEGQELWLSKPKIRVVGFEGAPSSFVELCRLC
jgi:hypothetical protein